jgi:prophage regulatory protein
MQLLTLKDVTAATRIGRSTVYRWVEEGRFPAPLALSPGCVRWRQEDIDTWVSGLRAANDNEPAGALH